MNNLIQYKKNFSDNENRDKLFKHLTQNGIECKIFYSPLTSDAEVHITKNKLNLPVARRLLKNSLSIPMHENMTIKQAQYVVSYIRSFFKDQ